MKKLIKKTYRIGKHHDIIVKKVAKKLDIKEAEVIRRRIAPFDEMVESLKQDMINSKDIDVSKE